MSEKSALGKGRDAQREASKRAAPTQPHSRSSAVLAVAVLGVVYGDIGTSPIYALRECFVGVNPIEVNAPNVFGILSLILWTLLLVISLKYMVSIACRDEPQCAHIPPEER